MADRVRRFDVSTLGKFAKTPTGGIRIPGNISRTGIQIYRDEKGNTIREYRSPEEVFRAETLASVKLAAVTDGHPKAGAVNTENYKQLAVGIVTEKDPLAHVKVDGSQDEFVQSDLIVTDAAAIRDIESGKKTELSAGYEAEVIFEAGVTPQGERYDAVQRNIVINHVALLEKGCARAGGHARLRLDGHEVPFEAATEKLMKIKIDGVDYEVGSEAHLQVLQNKQDAAEAKAKADAAELGRLTAENAKNAKLLADALAAGSPEAIATRANEIAKLRADAAKLLPADYAFEGKTDRQIKVDALTAALPTVAKLITDKTDDTFIGGAFLAALADASEEEEDPDEEEEMADKKAKKGKFGKKDGLKMVKSDKIDFNQLVNRQLLEDSANEVLRAQGPHAKLFADGVDIDDLDATSYVKTIADAAFEASFKHD